MNIHIVKGLLIECAHLIQPLFAASDFSFDMCMELRRTYDCSEPLPPPIAHHTDGFIKAPPLSFGCNFTQEQMTGIVSCANTYHLFCISEVCTEDMEALFSCKDIVIEFCELRGKLAELFTTGGLFYDIVT